MESTALKLMEEAGELAQAIGKLRGMSGERREFNEGEALDRITGELLDVAQTAVSMMFVLEEHYGVNIEKALDEHIEKLIQKGYLVPFVVLRLIQNPFSINPPLFISQA